MLRKDRRGVSPLIGYVLLIVGVLATSAIVYSWLQTYIPKESAECPEGISLYVQTINCTISEGNLTLKLSLKNNGLFNVDGFFIRATNSSEQVLATIDLVQYLKGRLKDTQVELFREGIAPLKYGESQGYIFEIGKSLNDIKTIEIIPAKFEILDGKRKFTSCSNAAIKEVVYCNSYHQE